MTELDTTIFVALHSQKLIVILKDYCEKNNVNFAMALSVVSFMIPVLGVSAELAETDFDNLLERMKDTFTHLQKVKKNDPNFPKS